MKSDPKTIRTVGITANPEKAQCGELIRKAARLIEKAGRSVVCDAASAALAGLDRGVEEDLRTLSTRVDLLMVFGGDGTMLGVARALAGVPTPILGVNVGGLGFLTALQSHEVVDGVRQVLAGNFELDPRFLIKCSGPSVPGEEGFLALNDFVIGRGAASRLIELDVRVDEEQLTRYRCDGLIVSSPTGSTAYSLAAGGAIVSPSARVLTITPICPHTLSNRSVIVGLDATIRVRVLSRRPEVFITADGQVQAPMRSGEHVEIRQSRRRIRLVRLGGGSFFNTLRKKLNWSGSNV